MTSINEFPKYLNLRAGEAVASAWCRGGGVVKAMVSGEELLGVGVERGGASHPWCGGAGHAQ
jgi:hypothetical protein